MPRNSAVLDNLREERDEARNAAIALAEGEDFDPTAAAYTQLEERAANLDGQIERVVKLYQQQDAADALDGKMAKSTQKRAAVTTEDRPLSWGEQWTRSDIWSEYPLRGTSAKLEIESRALPHALSSMGAALPASPVTDLTPPATPDTIVPLTNVITVQSNSIDYIVWTLTSGAAAVVPEKGVKPELEWSPSVTSSSLDTVAGRTSITRQLAEDASAVQSYINGELQREVTRKVEAEARAAFDAATLPTATGPADTGASGAVRAGIAAVQAAGYAANGFLISAADLVDMDLASMSLFRGDPRWGLTAVVDPEKDAGDPIVVGDFKSGVQHYRRNSVQLYVTDSHGTHFAENILDALAEQRCKTVVTRPAALVEVTAG